MKTKRVRVGGGGRGGAPAFQTMAVCPGSDLPKSFSGPPKGQVGASHWRLSSSLAPKTPADGEGGGNGSGGARGMYWKR